MSGKPRLLDLFCGAGGAAMGYARAGFDVVGVDIAAQPRYPFEFEQGDVFRLIDGNLPWFRSFDVIHASPPCQLWTAYRRTGRVGEYPNLIPGTRDRLASSGRPWVIENIEPARSELDDPILLCGSMFGLDVQRHRLFEASPRLTDYEWGCRHGIWGSDRYPGGRSKERTGSNRGLARKTVEIGTWDIPLPTQRAAMGVDWMTLEELSEAIPPAYTEYIGAQLLAAMERAA